jgi:Carboxypeptidase regulatory-like domain
MLYPDNSELFLYYILQIGRNCIRIVIVVGAAILLSTQVSLAQSFSQDILQPNTELTRQDRLADPLPQITPQSSPELAKQDSKNPSTTPGIIPQAIQILPVGLNINGKNVLQSMNVRGRDDGEKAVDFDRWLIPFDETIEALKFKIKEGANGEVEISSALLKFQFSAAKLIKDPQLGRSIAIQDLMAIPGFKIKFDINKYAIDIQTPAFDSSNTTSVVDTPTSFDGLATAKPAGWGVGAIQERVNVSGQNGTPGNLQGELKAVGNVFDANWYLRVDQSQFDRLQNWNITDGVVIRQRQDNDVVVGSQIPFWRRQSGSTGTYWGGTAIWREGFAPPTQLYASDFLVNERLQSARIGRSIAGQAFPGTIVQLVRGSQTQVLQEVLVNSSGVYRFDNLIVGNDIDNTFGQDYRVLLYPNGQLTANPEIRPAQFVTTPGQIPTGASAFVVSAGGNRVASGNFGNFDAVQGGVLYRRGLNESLTVGVGAAFDKEVLGVAEVFWQPNNIPLQVAFSATGAKQTEILGRFDYRPSNEFFVTGNIDQLSSRADANWKLSPGFTAVSNYDSNRGLSIGGEYSATNGRYNSTFVRAEIDSRARLRFGANQRLDNWLFSHQSNESATTTQVAYRLDKNLDNIDSGSELVANYQTNSPVIINANTSPTFTSLVWRYRAPQRTLDGRSLWQTEIGYGLNAAGSGLVAGLDLNITPGLRLRGSYRGAGDNGRDSYSLELNTTLLTSQGIQGTDAQIEELRAQGQVEFTAFLDTDGNGRQDPGEASYYDPLLFKINQKPLKNFRVANETNSGKIKLPSGSYRMDIDPAGYPINYRASTEAMRVDVAAGNITPISVALVPAYVTTGAVLDTAGKPVGGARVEAISIKNGMKISSVTNDAGIYYLEGLEQGEYKVNVSGLATKPDRIRITPTSQITQELNLIIDIPKEKPPEDIAIPQNSTSPSSSSRLLTPNINVSINF